MPLLGFDDLGELADVGGLVDVERSDPDLVADAGVSVVRQEPDDSASRMKSVAVVAADLGEVPEHRPRPERLHDRNGRTSANTLLCGSSHASYQHPYYVGGRHRALAMMQGVRRTVTMRLELLDPVTKKIIYD
ncbi:hypothetical protein L0U85_05310 [Glycomyces sp. L485]|uniref:hypothetical protein n=1 Tax=Glycomyces sp. L485 TaxID=2909235 RepID=UPI001F4A9F7A|nr:hypothetical protein [Glycomyces sp. L485]MCH7230276.1 hypothetical protein [Glycomyces sp. L485]